MVSITDLNKLKQYERIQDNSKLNHIMPEVNSVVTTYLIYQIVYAYIIVYSENTGVNY